jgi:ribosomal protein L29|tara:strand:+ start:656 stop:859 length:204 start_codon:yes stop_codon:yes gene_type:complete
LNINEIRALNVEELSNELQDTESALMNLRFKAVAMQLSDVNEINRTKRKMSRIKTVIRERELVKVAE